MRCCTITTGQRTQYIDSRDLFVEVRDTSTGADTSARRQPSVRFESIRAAATCTIEKADPVGFVPRYPRTNNIRVLRNHSRARIIGVQLEGVRVSSTRTPTSIHSQARTRSRAHHITGVRALGRYVPTPLTTRVEGKCKAAPLTTQNGGMCQHL